MSLETDTSLGSGKPRGGGRLSPGCGCSEGSCRGVMKCEVGLPEADGSRACGTICGLAFAQRDVDTGPPLDGSEEEIAGPAAGAQGRRARAVREGPPGVQDRIPQAPWVKSGLPCSRAKATPGVGRLEGQHPVCIAVGPFALCSHTGALLQRGRGIMRRAQSRPPPRGKDKTPTRRHVDRHPRLLGSELGHGNSALEPRCPRGTGAEGAPCRRDICGQL